MIRSVFLLLAIGVLTPALAEPDSATVYSGDVLNLPNPEVASKPLPTNGMSKATVKKRFGTPLKKDAAVGDPPISVWHYDDFKVFFEYQLVLHSVSESRKPKVYGKPQ